MCILNIRWEDELAASGSRPNSATQANGPPNNSDHSPGLSHSSSGGGFNFEITEGQSRRNLLAGCDNECSPVCDFLFVSGAKVASSYDVLVKNKISRIVNCAVTVVDSYFIRDPQFTYLNLNLLDSRQDDLTWFFCEVINFVEKGRIAGQRTLIHCEKGVSRSCSFAMAYMMWARHLGWKESFDIVKKGRPICAPNTGFWCNLIELSELLNGNTKYTTVLFRCASHLAHDPGTPVLKLCINQDSRKLMMPRTSLLDPRGIFILRCGNNNQNSRLFIWIGSNSSSNALTEAIRLAHFLIGVLSFASGVTIVQQFAETDEFRREIMDDGPFNHRSTSPDAVIYDDLYLADPIVISRQGTPLTKVRSGSVLPESMTPRPTSSECPSSVERRLSPQTQTPQRLSNHPEAKDVDIFVKVRRSSRENGGGDSMPASSRENRQSNLAASNVSSASIEAERIIATVNALTAARSTPNSSNPRGSQTNSLDPNASPDKKVSGKRNAEEMEVDSCGTQPSPSVDDDQPSPKYRVSNPPSLELSGENFESFRSQSDMNALNQYIDSCRIGGNSVDSHDSNAPPENSSESKSEFSSRMKALGVSLQLPTSQLQEPQNCLLSIVDKAAEIRQPDKSTGPAGTSVTGGKYEIWSGGFHNSAASVGSTTNSTASSLGGGKVNDSLEPIKELHPDHVDSPHVVTYRDKPLLFMATPSEDVPGWKDYVWLPMGVYDDEDLQEVLLIIFLPHILFIELLYIHF